MCTLIRIDEAMYHHEVEQEMWFPCSPSQHALKYQDVEQAGPPAAPLEFPTPIIQGAEWCTVSIVDHATGQVHHGKEVVMASQSRGSRAPKKAYLLKKRIASCTYGVVRTAMVLEKNSKHEESRDCLDETVWRSTSETVAIKVLSVNSIRHNMVRNNSNPLQAIGALQYVGNYHPNVLGCHDVLQTEEELFIVTPYLRGCDLYQKLMGFEQGRHCTWPMHPIKPLRRPTEQVTREWFSQLLQGLLHLQNKGICHRRLSLDNLLLDSENNLVIADFGGALRIPYTAWGNFGGVTDVSEGSSRRLIVDQGETENSAYLAPELVKRGTPFDGYAVDMWSAGIILFMLLVGRAPFRLAHPNDPKFHLIAQKGELSSLLRTMNINIGEDAADLLQNLLWHDPRRRLSLQEAMVHPWVTREGDHLSESFLMDEETKPAKTVRFDPSSECKDLNCRRAGLGEDTLGRLSLGRMASF